MRRVGLEKRKKKPFDRLVKSIYKQGRCVNSKKKVGGRFMRKYALSFYMNEEMKQKMEQSPIKKILSTSDYLRIAVAKFQEFEERERKEHEKDKEER